MQAESRKTVLLWQSGILNPVLAFLNFYISIFNLRESRKFNEKIQVVAFQNTSTLRKHIDIATCRLLSQTFSG